MSENDPTPAPAAAAANRRSRKRLWLQVAIVLPLLGMMALRLALPTLVENGLERFASDALKVRFAVGDVDIDLLEGGVAIHDVSLRAPEATEDLIRASRIAIDVDWGALLRGQLRAERIAIERPELHFEIDANGRMNWSLLGGEPEAGGPPPGDRPKATFRVSVAVFDVGAGTIVLIDQLPDGLPDVKVGVGALSLRDAEIGRSDPDGPVSWGFGQAEAREWRLGITPIGGEALDFTVRAVAGPAGGAGSVPVELELDRADGVALKVEGSFRPQPLGFDLAVGWKGLSSRAVAPLVLRGADVERGISQGDIRLLLDLGDGNERGLAVTGRVRHDDLALQVENDPPIAVSVERFTGEIERIWFPIPQGAAAPRPPIQVAWKQIDLASPSIEIKPARSVQRPPAQTPAETTGVDAGDTAEPAQSEAVVPETAENSAAAEEEAAPAPTPEAGVVQEAPAAVAESEPAAAEQGPAVVPTAEDREPREAAGSASESGPAASENAAAVPAEPAPEATAAALEMSIAALSLSDGRLAWHDAALGKQARQELTRIEFDMTGFHWPPATMEQVELVIRSLGVKPFTVAGQVRAGGADLAIEGRGIKLAPWNPIVRAHSEYSITGGSLSIESRFELREQTYSSPTKIRLHKLRVSTDGTGFVQTFGIPLSAALPLLSDPSGDIDLKIPVDGTLGAGGELQVGVSLVDAMREGIMNAITTVITSPLAIAGSVLSAGHGLAFLRVGEAQFAPGSSTLDSAAVAELDRAAAFIAKSADARLGLMAEIVSADLEAMGAEGQRPNVFRRMFYGGKSLIGGGRSLDSATYTLALDLARARLQAAEEHIVAAGLLSAERVIRKEWDEDVSEGTPRIVLRLDRSDDEDE